MSHYRTVQNNQIYIFYMKQLYFLYIGSQYLVKRDRMGDRTKIRVEYNYAEGKVHSQQSDKNYYANQKTFMITHFD